MAGSGRAARSSSCRRTSRLATDMRSLTGTRRDRVDAMRGWPAPSLAPGDLRKRTLTLAASSVSAEFSFHGETRTDRWVWEKRRTAPAPLDWAGWVLDLVGACPLHQDAQSNLAIFLCCCIIAVRILVTVPRTFFFVKKKITVYLNMHMHACGIFVTHTLSKLPCC